MPGQSHRSLVFPHQQNNMQEKERNEVKTGRPVHRVLLNDLNGKKHVNELVRKKDFQSDWYGDCYKFE